jgi:hypothetical protein
MTSRHGCATHNARVARPLSTILIFIPILALVGALPSWGHSVSWGYGPSGGIGRLLIILVILIRMGRLCAAGVRGASPCAFTS